MAYFTKKNIMIGSIVLVVVIVAVVVAFKMKKEKFAARTAAVYNGNRNILTADSAGNLGVANSLYLVNLSVDNEIVLAGNPGTAGQVITSNGGGSAPTWTSGIMRYIGSSPPKTIAAGTAFPANSPILTMTVNNITPGNTLLVTPNCPVIGSTGTPATMTVTVGNGTPQSITFYVWGYGSNVVYHPINPVVFTVQSDPSGSSTQTLTVTGTTTLYSPSVPVDFTCTVLEVS